MHEPVTGNGVRRYGPVRAGPEENHKCYQGAANLFCGGKKKGLREMGFLAQEASLGRPYQGLSILKGNFGERETFYQGL